MSKGNAWKSVFLALHVLDDYSEVETGFVINDAFSESEMSMKLVWNISIAYGTVV